MRHVDHAYPSSPDDPTLENPWDVEPGVEYTRRHRIPDCVLCQQGRCTQREFRHVQPFDSTLIVHGLLLN